MATTEPPPLTVVRPGEGLSPQLGSIGVDFTLWGDATGGALSVVEHPGIGQPSALLAADPLDVVAVGPVLDDQPVGHPVPVRL